MKKELLFAKQVAVKAGSIMMRYFKQGVEFSVKTDKSIVTKADLEINDMVINEVSRKYPSHSIFGEEKSLNKKSEYIWVCDPIDGTVPFSKGLPICMFSLALVKNGDPILGVTYDPFMNRMYYAIKGGGAFLNNKKIRVSEKTTDQGAVLDEEWWFSAQYDTHAAIYHLSMEHQVDVYMIGSVVAAASMVSAGQCEACVFAGGKGKNVDIAAVKIIVEEAGGIVTDLYGKSQRYDTDIRGAIIANKKIHKDIVSYWYSHQSSL